MPLVQCSYCPTKMQRPKRRPTHCCDKCQEERRLIKIAENQSKRDEERKKKTKVCYICQKRKPMKSFQYMWDARLSEHKISRVCESCHRERGKINSKTARKDPVRNEAIKKYKKRYRDKLRFEALRAYSSGMPRCVCCGEDFESFLTIDHINNNGAEHRRHIGISGGGAFYELLRKSGYPPGYQILCTNCNCGRARLNCTADELKGMLAIHRG